jgi:hypothetical protein
LTAIQLSDQKLRLFLPIIEVWRSDLIVTELRFHINPKENSLCKLVQKFKRDPMVGSKVMAIFSRY